MKLLGFHNNKHVVASMARHDYNSFGEGDDRIMADGGQPNIGDSAGYNKHWGKPIWIEVTQNYAELYNDWNQSLNSKRQYGMWNIEDVKILSPEEYPDTDSFEWRAEHEIWGTNGLDGNQPTTYVLLKNCEKNHLEKISALCGKRGDVELKKIADYWLSTKP